MKTLFLSLILAQAASRPALNRRTPVHSPVAAERVFPIQPGEIELVDTRGYKKRFFAATRKGRSPPRPCNGIQERYNSCLWRKIIEVKSTKEIPIQMECVNCDPRKPKQTILDAWWELFGNAAWLPDYTARLYGILHRWDTPQ